MKMLFLGGTFSKEMEDEILERSKGIVHYAANKLQWNLIDGFMSIRGLNFQVLSAPLIGSFPKDYNKLFINNHKYLYKDSIQCDYVPFCNLWGYRSISRKNSLIKQINEFASDKSSNKTIIVYSPHTPFLQAAVYAKKKDPSIHISLIVPDLPQFMNLNDKKTFAYSKLKELDIKIFSDNAKQIDSFVLLTEHMKSMLNVGERPYIIVEGVVNSIDTPDNNFIDNDNTKSIVYTGTLNKKFGVVNLVKAFHALENNDVSLKICGRGDSEKIIKEYAQKDKRIHFLGQISNEVAVNLQQNATVLVNPRQNNEEFTKYSFPSKNMEYLLSGNPVIAYKLDGIPNEYDDYFYYVKDDSIEALTEIIKEALELPDSEKIKFGNCARKFVIENKNSNAASLKIVEMIMSDREG